MTSSSRLLHQVLAAPVVAASLFLLPAGTAQINDASDGIMSSQSSLSENDSNISGQHSSQFKLLKLLAVIGAWISAISTCIIACKTNAINKSIKASLDKKIDTETMAKALMELAGKLRDG